MSAIQVLPITNARQRRLFLTFPWKIYRNDPLWVPPLLPERRKTIDPARGTFFQRGKAEFFIAWRAGKPVGTICTADDQAVNSQRGLHDCMIGFFECIADYSVAEALFGQARSWAQIHDLNSLYGPFNLDYEDGYGVLIEGRDRPPALLCGHTPPYYQEFFEKYGFHAARGDNLAFEIEPDLAQPAIQRLARLAERLRKRGHIQVRQADFSQWDAEVDRVHYLLNASTAHLPDFIPWQREALQNILEPLKQIVDPELVLFADVDGKTVGWFPGIPNVNEALIHANGLRYPWDYLKLGWYARRQPACLAIKSVVVLPEYWDTGVSVMLFDEMARRVAAKGYRWVDLSLTSDDNPDTPVLAERAGARLYKRYRVYKLDL
jgi:GNAT superfamily N-acetyltransferase